jgi:hypothetical protein
MPGTCETHSATRAPGGSQISEGTGQSLKDTCRLVVTNNIKATMHIIENGMKRKSRQRAGAEKGREKGRKNRRDK